MSHNARNEAADNGMKTLSWLSPAVEVRKSAIAGRGLYAIERLKKDEIVAIKGGHIVPRAVFLSLSHACQVASLQISDMMYVCPLTDDEIPAVMNYVNHSCNPNLGLRGQLFTVAMRDIAPGEELTADYCIAYTDSVLEIDCTCGHSSCRGKIYSDDWKLSALQQKYDGYFCQYLADRIQGIV